MSLHDYAVAHTTPDSPEVAAIIPSTLAQHEQAHMISGLIEARLLQVILLSLKARRVLELGCFTGYSALSMAEVLPEGGEVITLEIDPDIAQMAARHLEKSPHGPKVQVLLGPALKSLATLVPGFDFAFIDADKVNYPEYLEAVSPLIRSGGVIALDNTWLAGSVLERKGPAQVAVANLNEALLKDKRFTCVFLPIRDGLTLLYKH